MNFFLIKRRTRYGHQVLGESFHFGRYWRESDSKIIDEVEENESVPVSKNIFSMPTILGQRNMIVPTDLMLDLRNNVVAKWRKVELRPVFRFPWEEDGTDPVDEYIEEIEKAIDESEEYVELDPSPEDTTYQRLIDKYRVSNWIPETNYWEMFLENSTRCAVQSGNSDALKFEWSDEERPVFHNLSDKSQRQNRFPCNDRSLFSYSNLLANKILSIDRRTFALLPEQYSKVSDFLESEFWECQEVENAATPHASI